MSPTVTAFLRSLHTANVDQQRVLVFNQVGNPKRSLGQLVPYRDILWTASEFGHGLARSGKSQETV